MRICQTEKDSQAQPRKTTKELQLSRKPIKRSNIILAYHYSPTQKVPLKVIGERILLLHMLFHFPLLGLLSISASWD